METITLHSRVGADGLLNLQVPVKATNADLEIVLIVQPLAPQPAGHGWPAGFFEEVAGGWQGERLMREDQGDYEIRDELK
jgi:hypothetical protein